MRFAIAIAVSLSVSLIPPSAKAFNVQPDGTVFDPASNLIWQQNTSAEMTWLDAVAYCERLDTGGNDRWRLPFKEEIADLLRLSPERTVGLEMAFPSTPSGLFWSFSSPGDKDAGHWMVNFTTEEATLSSQEQNLAHARCVHETPEAVYRPFLEQWAKAWSSQDVDRYLGFYSKNFAPAGNLSYEEWKNARKKRLTTPILINIDLSDIRVVSESGDRTEIQFMQTYRSDRYHDKVEKILTLAVEGGRLVILEERTKM